MQHKISQITKSALFTSCILLLSIESIQAGPGNLSQIPLFVAPPTPPNIFFMLDDSGSMDWSMPSDGVSSGALITRDQYDTIPDNAREWNVWCLGANLMAYDPSIEYKPWAANMPGTNLPFPNQADLDNVWVDPYTRGAGSPAFTNGENVNINGDDDGTANLSAAPVIQWTDDDGDGAVDVGDETDGSSANDECAKTYNDGRNRVQRADSLSAEQQTNFGNWFAYYRLREHATKAAVTRVISTSSARMGMATLWHNDNVGKAITDMTVAANKEALLGDIIKIRSSGSTPLRTRLNWVGEYFNKQTNTPNGLNIGGANAPSPILDQAHGGECQQNFAMLMTDGQWNGNGTAGHQDRDPDVFVFPAHRDNTSNILGDIAMKWYKTDLAPGLDPKVPIQTGDAAQNLDENAQQHMVTFGVAFGPTGTIDQNPVDRRLPFLWPIPARNADTTVDDLRHAAYNGRGKFLSASNPQTLITALQDVISDIETRQGSGSAVSFNSTALAAGSSLFFANFNTENWTGDVESYSIDPITGDISEQAAWSAASQLDARSNADMTSNRVIYTKGVDALGRVNGVLFNWSVVDPQPTANIVADFKKNPDTTVDIAPFVDSQGRLEFVRGDTSNDGSGLIRERASRLGDIISSAPQFVGKPLSNWSNGVAFGVNGNKYSDYQTAQNASPRQTMVYVGANDGMLHGFKAVDGEEVMAYLPSAVASDTDDSGFHYLSESDYQHRYYVDGSPVSADVFIRTETGGSRDWRTLLIGALRGGGQGLYALDVTDPALYLDTVASAKKVVLWEFTNVDDADLGFTYSKPEIVMMNNNQWAVVFGNGYNASGTNNAKLFILFIEKGIDGEWATVGDYIKIDTGVGDPVNKNGLSTPALKDLDNDGKIDLIYAGDLQGNMWSFDVSDSDENNWQIAHHDGGGTATPLFSAGNTKPITMKPLLIRINEKHEMEGEVWIADEASNLPNILVAFGTGQYIALGDAANGAEQTFYGIWDTGGNTVAAAKLVEQEIALQLVENDPENGGNFLVRTLSSNAISYQSPPSDGDLGWFINLPESGERVTVDAFELLGAIFFNTLTPSATSCSSGGDSWLMAVDMKSGGSTPITSFDTNGDGVIDNQDDGDDRGTGFRASGTKFDFGIASATSVISTVATGQDDSIKTFGFTSGTSSSKPIKAPLPTPEGGGGGGGGVTGSRQGWIQLIN